MNGKARRDVGVLVVLSQEEKARIREAAEAESRSMSNLLRLAIERYLTEKADAAAAQ